MVYILCVAGKGKEKMEATIEMEILTKENSNLKFSIKELSIQQLIDLVIGSGSDHIGLELREEIITRGKDNIETRIAIKKCCKAAVLKFEDLLKNYNKNSEYKNNLLNSVSLLDKLQLEWQKHDLRLKL